MSTTVSTVSQQRTLLLATQPSSSAVGVRDPVLRGIARRDRHGMLILHGIPSFNDPTAKRQWIRQHIAAAFRSFGKHEYVEGTSGYISVTLCDIYCFADTPPFLLCTERADAGIVPRHTSYAVSVCVLHVKLHGVSM